MRSPGSQPAQSILRLFRIARAETELSGRLDHQIGSKHSLLLKYALTNNREAGDAFHTGGLVDPSGRGSTFIEDQGITGSLTSVLSDRTLNSVRFQVSTRRAALRTADQIGPEINIAGLIDFGRPYDGNDKRRENHYEFADLASLAKGRHLISFGADVDWIRENVSAYDGFGAVIYLPDSRCISEWSSPINIDKRSEIPALDSQRPSTLDSSKITGHLPSTLRLMQASATTSSTCPINSSTIQTTSLPELVWRTALHRSGHCGLGSVFSLTATSWPR